MHDGDLVHTTYAQSQAPNGNFHSSYMWSLARLDGE